MLTPLGSYCILIAGVIIIVLFIHITGAGGTSEEEPYYNSYFRLHEAFFHPYGKMLSQAIVIIVIIAIFDSVNVQNFHSQNLELALSVGLMFVLLWVLLGYVLIYSA